MIFVSAFLRLFNFKIEEKTFDGNRPLGYLKFKGTDGDFADISFEKPVDINLITLFENGESVTDFEIYAELDGEMKMIYKQNRISKFRVCAIDDVKTKKIRIKILKTRKGKFGEIRGYVYNLPKKEREFRRTAYVVADNYETVDRENLKHYNKFNIIGCLSTDNDGNITFKGDNFACTLSMIREYDENADVVATILPSGNPADVFKKPETIENIKKFLDDYNLNGVSFDWEYPKNFREWRIFENFIVKLKEAIGEKTITIALASWLPHRFGKKTLECIDVAEVMTYDDGPKDIDGYHSEFFISGANAIYHFVKMGFKLEQLNLGLPYYARPVNNALYWKNYKDEADKMDRFTNIVEGEYEDYNNKKKKITVKTRFYNCPQMIEDKTTFCIYAGVGGVMVWHLATDTSESHELCLSKTLTKTVNRRIK